MQEKEVGCPQYRYVLSPGSRLQNYGGLLSGTSRLLLSPFSPGPSLSFSVLFLAAGFKRQTKQRFLSVGSYSPLQGRCPGKSVSENSLGTDHPASPISTLLGSAWTRRMDTISQFQMLFSSWSATRSSKNLWAILSLLSSHLWATSPLPFAVSTWTLMLWRSYGDW